MITIVKIGGNIIDDSVQLKKFLRDFADVEGEKILIHGGGKIATEMAASLNLKTTMIDGRRVTDAETLKIAVMTYAGWINKTIVAGLAKENCSAIGLTGADANLIPAEKRKSGEIDFGFVGDPVVEKVNVQFVLQLLKSGIVPVIAPITHDEQGQLLNTNADTIASVLAMALAKNNEVKLIYCFEKNGVLANAENPESVIPELNLQTMYELKASGKINAGMIPKLEAAFKAKNAGAKKVLIGHAAFISTIVSHPENCTEICS